eukprot:COSAG02_NODE_2978_length_7629_cov_3.880478_5_plen_100_part_00
MAEAEHCIFSPMVQGKGGHYWHSAETGAASEPNFQLATCSNMTSLVVFTDMHPCNNIRHSDMDQTVLRCNSRDGAVGFDDMPLHNEGCRNSCYWCHYRH